ncbi:MAG: amino acid permease [Spirochaetes bacterium]|nr:amino acid permease [Spirochaetota bacterium]
MKLKKVLSLFNIFCIASGAMISSGLFILPGLAHARAGAAVIFSYLLAGLIAIPGMLSIAEMTTAMPRAGGDSFTIIRSMGPAVGTVAGLLSWFSLSMKSAFALLGMSVFTVLLVDLNIHIIALVFCIFFLLINIIGIKEAGLIQVIMVIGLFLLMTVYIIIGFTEIKIQYLIPFAPHGIKAVFSTAGFVFVSYAGLLKIASISEEIKNPKKNIPLGMILSLAVVSVFYTLMVYITSGVVPPAVLHNTMTPISEGANIIMGYPGKIILSIAAVLAFLSTANAGIMTSARSLVPLSRDNLFPKCFANINTKYGTPHNALILTVFFIVISLFIKLELLVEAASVVFLLTNILVCISVIILRESRLQNYQPSFRIPWYPWIPLAGIFGLFFLIIEMGMEALVICGILCVAGFFTYWFYGRIRGIKEFALIHLLYRLTAKELKSRTLETELKEIIRERDNIINDRFDKLIEKSVIIDVKGSKSLKQFFKTISDIMAEHLSFSSKTILNKFMIREKRNSSVIAPGIAIPHIVIESRKKFFILLARCSPGIIFSDKEHPVHTVFVLAGTKQERNFHLRALAAIAQIVQDANFEESWLKAGSIENLRDIVLLAKRKRT